MKKTIDTLDNLIKDLNMDKKPCSFEGYKGKNKIVINNYNLDTISGTVRLTYNTIRIPDMIEIFYDGRVVASTKNFVPGVGEINFYYKYKIF